MSEELQGLQGQIASIDSGVDRIIADNKRMRSLLSQAALFIVCQPGESALRTKWLKEVEELSHG